MSLTDKLPKSNLSREIFIHTCLAFLKGYFAVPSILLYKKKTCNTTQP